MDREPRQLIDDRDNIPDSTPIYRRVSWELVGGRARCAQGETAALSKNAFRDWPADWALRAGYARPCMSVAIGTVLADPREMLGDRRGFGVVVLTAGELRNLTRRDGTTPEPQGVMLSPTETEPWHGVVFCLDCDKQRGNPACAAISDLARWVIPLVNDDPS
jgi:hypothetical protein